MSEEAKRYKVVYLDGKIIYKDMKPSLVRTFIRSNPKVSSVFPTGQKLSFQGRSYDNN